MRTICTAIVIEIIYKLYAFIDIGPILNGFKRLHELKCLIGIMFNMLPRPVDRNIL